MTCVVVAASSEFEGMTREMLPFTPITTRGADRIHFFYQMVSAADCSYTDLEGQPLIEVHSFSTRGEAEAWVMENTRRRYAFLSAGGRAQ